MKKRLCVFVCLILCMTVMAACSKSENPSDVNEITPTQTIPTEAVPTQEATPTEAVPAQEATPTEAVPAQEATPTEAVPDESVTPEVTPEITEIPEPATETRPEFLPYTVGTETNYIYANDNRWQVIGKVSVPYICMDDSDSMIAEGVGRLCDELRESGVIAYKSLQEMTEGSTEEEIAEMEENPYCAQMVPNVVRSDTDVFSAIIEFVDYTGGIHPNSLYDVVNISGSTGLELTLDDVFGDKSALAPIIVDRLIAEYPDTVFFDLEETVKKEIEKNTISFLIGYTGVSFWFSPYEVASYADGLLTVSLPFEEYGDLFVKKYDVLPEEYTVAMTSYLPYYLDADGNGSEDMMRLSLFMKSVPISFEGDDDFYDMPDTADVSIGEKEVLNCEFPEWSYDQLFYFVQQKDGGKFFYVSYAEEGGWYRMDGYKCTADKFTPVEFGAEQIAVTEPLATPWSEDFEGVFVHPVYVFAPGRFGVSRLTEIVGTQNVISYGKIDSEGAFVPEDNRGILERYDTPITLLEAVDCLKTDEFGIPGEAVTLPEGTILYGLYMTDDSTVIFADSDLKEYYLVEYVYDDLYGYTLNGKWPGEVLGGAGFGG